MGTLPILIVEDDEPTQMLLRAIMSRFGYASEVAANGKQALDLLGQHEYAVILLDLMMPEVGGHDVLAFLKEQSSSTPVIVCTAAGIATSGSFDPTVVKAVVRKPFDVEELAIIVEGLVGQQTVSGGG